MSSKFILELRVDDKNNVVDLCGNTITNSSYSIVDGKFQKAIKFIRGDLIKLAHNVDFNLGNATDFTLCTWIKYAGVGGGYSTILCRYGDFGGGFSATSNSSLNPYTTFGTRSAYSQIFASVNWTVDGLWHHICVTRKNKIARLFCDGIKQGEKDMSSSSFDMSDTTNGIIIGTDGVQGNTWLDASIENLVVISGVALWDSDFVPPDYLLQPTKKIYVSNGSAYGVV